MKKQHHNLILDDNLWDLFVKFFREIKGYQDWTEEQIDLSMNNDDIQEFITWIATQTTDKPLDILIMIGSNNLEEV